MKFVETLSEARRLVVDPDHLKPAIASLGQRFAELAGAVLRPGPANDLHTLLLHSNADRVIPGAGLPVALPVGLIDARLADQGYALLHAPYPDGADFASLFPAAGSLFLRRAFTGSDQQLLLVFAVQGIDAEFASRHGASLLAERLLHRIDDHILQTQIHAVTRKLEMQIDEVKVVKEKLLPAADHQVHGARYAVHYQPCAGGGGDYYEIADLRGARRRLSAAESGIFWGMMIGDVSGHGPGAAVEVAMLDSILRTYRAGPRFHPGHVLTYCNRHMFTRQLRGGFATVFIVNYDADRETLIYASAGHPPGLVKFADRPRDTRLLECGRDIPMGVEPDHEWSSENMHLGSRDMLVLYTDGATESESPTGQQFGIDGIRQATENSEAKNPHELLADILTSLNRHTANMPGGDDCTIVVVQPDLEDAAKPRPSIGGAD